MSAGRQHLHLLGQRTAYPCHGTGHAGRRGSGLRHDRPFGRRVFSSRAARTHGRSGTLARRKGRTRRRPFRCPLRHGQAPGGAFRTARSGLAPPLRTGTTRLHAEQHAHHAALPESRLAGRRFPARRSRSRLHHRGNTDARKSGMARPSPDDSGGNSRHRSRLPRHSG